ncbi:YihY/virulence factor BrkB family protein [Phenylobacterium sp. J367]|uniref:YihY/virulence factor BrkB family protein n=1 Tax=Phenylobacterium sp. J367 TaxID=2898435 RepID=UPI002151E779|nr:YihY/virulence factor BrkB family protein [Phenylobacterium sp. J367]MCR5878973.1 YihY/virulence factor BrkB family protein [Phenylobacterium sp. J367]
MARTVRSDRTPRRGGLTRLLLGAAPWVGLAAMTALWAKASRHPPPGLSNPEIAAPEHFEHTEPGRGRLAVHPLQIPWKGWRDVMWRVYRELNDDRVAFLSAGVTFYALLALAPAVGVFVSLYGLISDVETVSKQLGQLAAFVPPDVLAIVGEQMTRLATQQPAQLSVAFLLSLVLSGWTATLGVRVLVDALNVAYDEKERRPYLLRAITIYSFTFAAMMFLAAVTALLVATPLWLEEIGAGELLIPLRWLVLYGLVAGAFAIIYRYGPSRRWAQWRWVLVGAVLAAAVWMGGSLGYSWYVNNVARFQITYGSLGAIVGFLVWIWFSVMALLLGAEINAEIEHQTALDTTIGEPKPMGTRGAVVADSVGLAFVGVRKGVGILWGTTRRQVNNLMGRSDRNPPPLPTLPPPPPRNPR